MPLPAVLELLHRELVPYSVIPHAPATTSPQTASAAAVSGRELAKTVMILVDGKLAMAVRAAADYANFDQLRDQIGARRVDSAGRPPCPLCGLPLDAGGHICPRQNGYRRASAA